MIYRSNNFSKSCRLFADLSGTAPLISLVKHISETQTMKVHKPKISYSTFTGQTIARTYPSKTFADLF